MKIAREFSNSSPVTNLPYTKLLALLQVPEGDREEFIQETHLVGGQEKSVTDMSKRELEQAIKERDEARKLQSTYAQKLTNLEKVAVSDREKAKREYDNYMNALVKLEDSEKRIKALRSNRDLDINRISALEKQIKDLESRPVDVAVQELSEGDKDKLRQEGAESTRQLYEKQLQQARRDLEEAKKAARAEIGLDRDQILSAAESFRDSLDAVWDNFKMILRLSPEDAVESVSQDCIKHMQGIVSEIINSAAIVRNDSLLEEDVELPPEDGLEDEI